MSKSDQQRFLSRVKPELAVVQPVAIITWGKVAGGAVEQLELGIKHLKFPHPSGAANGEWKKLMQQSPTNPNKLTYWRAEIAQNLEN